MSLGAPVVGKYEEPSVPMQLADRAKMLATPQYKNGTLVSWARCQPVRHCRWQLSPACGTPLCNGVGGGKGSSSRTLLQATSTPLS